MILLSPPPYPSVRPIYNSRNHCNHSFHLYRPPSSPLLCSLFPTTKIHVTKYFLHMDALLPLSAVLFAPHFFPYISFVSPNYNDHAVS